MASFDDGGIGISSAELWLMVYPTIPIPFKHELRPVPQSSADQSGMAPPQGNGPGVSSALGWQAAQPSYQMPGPVQHAVHGNGPGVSSAFGWQAAHPSHQMPGPVQHAVPGNPPLPPPRPSALAPTRWVSSPGKIPVMIPDEFFDYPSRTKYRCADCKAEFHKELSLRHHQLATKHERQKDGDTDEFVCAECGKGFDTFEEKHYHRNNAHLNRLDCRINGCQYRGFSVPEMTEHMYQRHSNECPYPACGWRHPLPPHPPGRTTQKGRRYTLADCTRVALHWDAHHADDEHKSHCPYPACTYLAADMTELMEHIHHHRINHYCCLLCGQIDIKRLRLALHIASAHSGLASISRIQMSKLTRVFLDERQNE